MKYIHINIQRLGHIFLTLGMVFSILGCEPFLDVELPPNQQTGEGIFNEIRTIEAAIGDIYAHQREQGFLTGKGAGLGVALSLYSDEMMGTESEASDVSSFYTHTIRTDNNVVSGFWHTSYQDIYAANAAIERLEKTSIEDDRVGQLLGEAYFIRGLLHLYLSQVFGEIPYIRSTDYQRNGHVSRNSIEDVMGLVIQDLVTASGYMEHDYQDGTRTRPNALAAQFALARVYLYDEQWELARKTAKIVIDSELYELNIPLGEVFKKESPNTVWQFLPAEDGYNTYEGQYFIVRSIPTSSPSLSTGFYHGFEDGDNRRETWVGSISDGMDTIHFPYKYREYTSTDTSLEYSKVFRIAEMYLVRAEAKWHLNDDLGAREDLNLIRERAGLSPMGPGEDLGGVILRERRSELFTEFGHRWFDLKRWDMASTVLSSLKPGWGESSYLFPIPETELNANPNLLPQNKGY